MKAFKIILKKDKFKNDGQDDFLDYVRTIEQVILCSPPGGANTEYLLKTGVLYNRFDEAKQKNKDSEEWVWILDSEQFQTLKGCFDAMRWGNLPVQAKLAVIRFVKHVTETKEEEVTVS